jgi:death-on-curing protein
MDLKDPAVIIQVHNELIDEFGGEQGLISENLLLSSLFRPFYGLADGTELYPAIIDKAAVLLHSLIKNHPFVDGNKRTASYITNVFLGENNLDWNFNNDEIVEYVLDIANDKIDIDYIKSWIAVRIRKLK